MGSGDNIGAGSSADSTHILHKARELGVSGILQTLFDPEAVEKCMNKVGSMITLMVGGKSDSLHGEPIEITGKITKYFQGEFEAEVMAELEEGMHDAPTKGAVAAEPMKKVKNGSDALK